jgi:hypothetical protein
VRYQAPAPQPHLPTARQAFTDVDKVSLQEMFAVLHLRLYLLAQLNGSGRTLGLAGTRRNRWLLDGMHLGITNRPFLVQAGSFLVVAGSIYLRPWCSLPLVVTSSPSPAYTPATSVLSHKRESPRSITTFQNGQRPTLFHNGKCLHQEGLPRCILSCRPEVTGPFASWQGSYDHPCF